MAMSYKEFRALTNAQKVGSRLIVGERENRRFVGSIEGGVFNLNAEGQALLEALEAGKSVEEVKPARQKKPAPSDAEE